MTKIAFVNPANKPAMTVYYDSKVKANPYRVFLEGDAWNEKYNYPRPFKRHIASYADLLSAVHEMHEYILENNEDRR